MFTKKLPSYIFILFLCAIILIPDNAGGITPEGDVRVGVWITVFSRSKALHSRENADNIIRTCKVSGVDDIYLQVYRADKAYYDSDITDKSVYEGIMSGAGEDLLGYFIKSANESGIKVHAWMNLFSIAQNRDSNILKKFGMDVLTQDQHGRFSMGDDKKSGLDKYYIRENQLFLEPGDIRVREYLAEIAEEIISKYPGFSGLHFDYARYPAVVPFIPGSRFSSHGISYGYGGENIKKFELATGINIKTTGYSRENFRLWDDWRREQVSGSIKYISERIRAISPSLEISGTIVPSVERTYLTTLQDWTKWLDEGYVDYVVAMNYTDDTKLMDLNSRSLLFPGVKDRVHIGVAAYLLKKKPDVLRAQLKSLRALSPAGVVIFSYDDVDADKTLQGFLYDNFSTVTGEGSVVPAEAGIQ